MKKAILYILMVLIFTVSLAYGAGIVNIMKGATSSQVWHQNSSSTEISGYVTDLQSDYSRVSCQVSWGNQAMSSTVVAIKGGVKSDNLAAIRGYAQNTTSTNPSIELTMYGRLATENITMPFTSSTAIFSFTDTPIRYLGVNYISKVGGSATSTMDVDCLPMK